MSQFLRLSNNRIQLRQTQIQQWDTLASTQQKDWQVFQEEAAQQLLAYKSDKVAYAELKYNQSMQLINLMQSQRQQRQQMRERHKQELALFIQQVETP